LSLFLADKYARQSVMAAAKLPSDCGVPVLTYISYFAPSQRFLTADRAAKLITECCDMILKGVSFDRQHIQAPSHVWAQAFEIMATCEIQRPLKNHHYLLRIVQRESAKKWEKPISEVPEDAVRAPIQRDSNASLQPVGSALPSFPPSSVGMRTVPTQEHGNEERVDPLKSLSHEARKQALQAAEKELLDMGFKPDFMGVPLIEQKAREVLEESHAKA